MIQTDISTFLSGKEGAFHYGQLEKELHNQLATAQAKLRTGLSKEQFAQVNARITAITASKLILKTLQIAQSE